MRNVHPEVFRLFNDINTRAPNRKLINDLLFWKKKIPKENKEILNKIINQFNDIKESLQPLMDLGVSFDLWLVGGSVRDLLLGNGNLIKDLDIMLTFQQPVTPKFPGKKAFLKKSKLDFTIPQLQNIVFPTGSTTPFEHWDFLDAKNKARDYKIQQKKQRVKQAALFDMITCCLGQNINLTEVYKPSVDEAKQEELSEKYVDNRITGVIKLHKESWSWPVDILVSVYSVDTFLTAFDFGICKVGMELLRGADVREQRDILPHTPENLMKRVRVTRHFLEDVTNKQISMLVSEVMTMRQLQHSCENHLERLEKKYPWKLKVDIEPSEFLPGPPQAKKTDVRQEYLESFFLKRKLDRNLDKKEIEKKTVKKI